MFNREPMQEGTQGNYSAREANLMRQREQTQIQADFVVNLLPNLQHYYRQYLGVPLFDRPPYLFSKLPLTQDEFACFIASISQSTTFKRRIVNVHNLHMIDRAFEGRSTYATRRITLPLLTRLCNLLGVPIEAILYGTLDTPAIAHYNYVHYDEMPSAIHLYLSRRVRHSNNFSYLLTHRPFCDYTDRALGDLLGISRTAANSLKKDYGMHEQKRAAGIPTNKVQLQRYAEIFDTDPEFILEVPVVFMASDQK